MSVEVYPSTMTSVIPPSATLYEGDSIQLIANGASTYSWSNFVSLSCVNCPDPFVSPKSTTTYIVTGTDENGCESSQTVTIFVQVNCSELFVPTIFSPNGEGLTVNENLCVFGNCITSLQFEVFNSWGEKVFETNDSKLCWDGNHKNKPCQSGVYVYKLIVTKTNGETFVKSGNVMLTR
jgi:gliding motility-associated-like protein